MCFCAKIKLGVNCWLRQEKLSCILKTGPVRKRGGESSKNLLGHLSLATEQATSPSKEPPVNQSSHQSIQGAIKGLLDV